MRKIVPLIFIFLVTILFFKDFIFRGLIPIPADTIVGMYHPWRDFYAKDYPNGIPFKNPLITDPVRQQYPWKMLAIESLKNGKIPYWNQYTFSGTPLLANFQAGVFYPFNLVFFIFPFNIAWGVYIFLQFFLGAVFMYFYLKNLNLNLYSSLFGSIVFIFSGVFVAWGWWGNIIHTLIWLPLLLLCVDKITKFLSEDISNIKDQKSKINTKNEKLAISNKQLVNWSIIFVFSLCSSFFAGHLQVFFYVFLTTAFYLLVRIIVIKNKIKTILIFGLCFLIFGLITIIQWLPTLHFINQSARLSDQVDWQKTGWFIPWQNLVQFIAPDFFGNPTTGNYWGVWNYGEFIGYIGVLPFILVIYSLFFRKDKKVLFFGSLFFLTLLFSLPTPFAKLPYLLKIPFISTSQPTRLLVITVFVLSVLSALGLDYLTKEKPLKNIIKILCFFILVFISLWIFVFIGINWQNSADWSNNLSIAKRNLILPTIIFLTSAIFLFLINKLKGKFYLSLMPCYLLLVFDLFRFGWKFLPFVKEDYIFPKTKTIEFLQEKQKEGRFRIMSTDERIFPPNFSIVYKIETIDGYDPLYLKSYAGLINKMEKREENSGFNRIITPKNFESPLADLLNVRFILSLDELSSQKLKKVFQEGETRVYENLKFIKKPYFDNKYEY